MYISYYDHNFHKMIRFFKKPMKFDLGFV